MTGHHGTELVSTDDIVVAPDTSQRLLFRRRHAEPPALESDPRAVSAPDDVAVYDYLGPQMRWVQLFLIAAFVLAAWSLIAFSTAHPMLWPALIILVANVIGTAFSIVTGLFPRRVTWRSHQQLVSSWSPTDGAYPSVDVFLPACGEDLAILRNTYRHVAALDWPATLAIHVLDDADKAEVRFLAAEYGFDYVVRPDRGHLRKAGNLRHAFRITSAELIVIFDADFCPRADFLHHLVPYLDDPNVAIAQSPQCFATTEAMGWIQRTAGATQEFFYRWVLPSRDRIGAANCVGTSAVYRRSALDRVGGFAAIEHSEDLHTGRHLQQAGYDLRYVPIVLSQGLCPLDLAGFLNQQYRWCQGSLSRLVPSELTDPPRRPTVLQRFALWAGVFYYLTTAMNVFLLFLPGIIMAGFYPEDVHPAQLVPFLLGLWVYVVLFPLVSRTRWRFEVLRIQIAYSFAHTIAIWHKIIRREIGWVPTGAIGKSNSLARSISALGAVVLGASLIAFWVVIVRAVVDYGLAEFWMMVGFVLAYTYLAAPLVVAFVRVLLPRRALAAPSSDDPVDQPVDEQAAVYFATAVDRSSEKWDRALSQTRRRPLRLNWNRISGFEVTGYTIAILFTAALALGWFDIMLPWATS